MKNKNKLIALSIGLLMMLFFGLWSYWSPKIFAKNMMEAWNKKNYSLVLENLNEKTFKEGIKAKLQKDLVNQLPVQNQDQLEFIKKTTDLMVERVWVDLKEGRFNLNLSGNKGGINVVDSYYNGVGEYVLLFSKENDEEHRVWILTLGRLSPINWYIKNLSWTSIENR